MNGVCAHVAERLAVKAVPASTETAHQRGVEEVIGDCAIYEHGVRRPGRVPLEQAGNAAAATDGFVWVGLQQPSAADVEAVAVEFGLPPLAVEDAVKAHQRPKLELGCVVLTWSARLGSA